MLAYPPDLKNGSFLQVEKSLDRAINSYPFNLRQVKVLRAVMDKTYGWGKIKDDISVSQISEMTGIQENHCSSTIKSLVELNVITKEKGVYAYKIGINKYFRDWKDWEAAKEWWNKDDNEEAKPEKQPKQEQELELTKEQLNCWEWAKTSDYWQDKVATQADFLKAYKRQGNGIKTQYEAFMSKSAQRTNGYNGKKKPEDFEFQDFGGLIKIDDDNDFLEGDFKVMR